jgi:ferredoxin
MAPHLVKFDREACIGCGSCNRCENWGMDDQDKAFPKRLHLTEGEVAENKDVEETCPTNAIKIVED